MAAAEFSAYTTLNVVRLFVSKAITLSVAARHLLWLHQWQADIRPKWRLASAPFKGEKLFEESLDPLLGGVERQKEDPAIPL